MNWQLIATAPRDGTLIDVWCVPPEDSDFEPESGGIRLTEVFWQEPDAICSYTGWMRCCDDGDWDGLEVNAMCQFGLPAWIPTHWMRPPEPPEAHR